MHCVVPIIKVKGEQSNLNFVLKWTDEEFNISQKYNCDNIMSKLCNILRALYIVIGDMPDVFVSHFVPILYDQDEPCTT